MFDFAWSEIALIGVVALIAIGPKDMPAAIRSMTEMIKKARRMAGEFQGHVDEMVREANLGEVKDQISQIRNFDFRGEVERAVDADGSLRSTLASNPLDVHTPAYTPPSPVVEVAVGEAAVAVIERPSGADPAPFAAAAPEMPAVPVAEAPSFIPPGTMPPRSMAQDEPPAFIPPGATRA